MQATQPSSSATTSQAKVSRSIIYVSRAVRFPIVTDRIKRKKDSRLGPTRSQRHSREKRQPPNNAVGKCQPTDMESRTRVAHENESTWTTGKSTSQVK